MALVTSLGLFLLSVIVATLSRIFAAEAEAWSPFIVRGLTRLAVRRLPLRHRDRYNEEWQSHLNDVPGVLGKFVMAAGFVCASYRMAWIVAPLRIDLALTDTTQVVGKTVRATLARVDGGTPPYKLDSITGLPEGFSIAIDDEGTIWVSGITTTAGTFAVNVKVSDSGLSLRQRLRTLLP